MTRKSRADAEDEKPTRGPQDTLRPPKHVRVAMDALADQGYATLTEAALEVGFTTKKLGQLIRKGLPPGVHQTTVDRLTRLKILDLVPKQQSA